MTAFNLPGRIMSTFVPSGEQNEKLGRWEFYNPQSRGGPVVRTADMTLKSIYVKLDPGACFML